MRETKIFCGSSHQELSKLICNRLGHSQSAINTIRNFNGEISVNILESVRNQDVFIIQSSSLKTNDHLLELLIIINACKGASARKITAVIPCFFYAKQSKRKNLRIVANMLTMAGLDHLITVDLHAAEIQGFFNLPVDNLVSEPSIIKYITDSVPEYKKAVVVSKNAGGVKRVTSLADKLGVQFSILHTNNNEYEDDMIDNSKTFTSAAKYLVKSCKANKVIIIAAHGILSDQSLKKFDLCEYVDKVVVTNTFPISESVEIKSNKLVIIDISGTLSEAIRRNHNGESISYLFNNPI